MFKRINRSYSTKLTLVFTMLNFVCIIVISTLFSLMLNHIISQNYENIVNDLSRQIKKEQERKVDDLYRVSKMFIYDENFHSRLSQSYDGLERQNILNDYLLVKGRSSMMVTDLKAGVQLYVQNTTIPEYYYNISDPENTRPLRMSFEVMHLDRIAQTDYVRDLLESGKYIFFRQIENDEQNGMISMLVKLENFSTTETSGILVIKVRIEELFGYEGLEKTVGELDYKIRLASGKEIFQYNPSYQERKSDFVVEKELDQGGFLYELAFSRKNIDKGFSATYVNIMIIALVCFVLAFLFTSLFKRHIYSDISKILHGISEFQVGNYEYEIETVGNDEFSRIAASMNTFAHSMGHLVNDVYEVMIQKQDVEYQMLRAKINPHFMYNVFNIISQMAKAGKNDEIVQIVDKTAKFYRSALSARNDDGTIRGELHILRQYFEIIEIQRPDTVTFLTDVDDNVLDCIIPSFTLQPIVENSVKHAIVDGKITITVSAHYNSRDNLVEIVVQDDGIGMTEQQLKELFTLRENRGYGLYNINERIRLKYADPKYNIYCESTYGKGAKIILTIAYEKSGEAEF